MPYRHRRKPQRLATQTIELALAAPQVWAHRMTRLALMGISPSLRDRREFYLMGTEKVAAFDESWNAMLVEMLQANLKFALTPVFSWWWPWTDVRRLPRLGSARTRRTTVAILSSGLAPVHRRAVANARRLGRKRVL
jgi:hypothetical protein